MDESGFIRSLEQNIDGVAPGALTPGTVLDTLPQWDSLAVLTVIALVSEQSGRTLSGTSIRNCRTVADLFVLAHGV
jgi:acyl carrier protein